MASPMQGWRRTGRVDRPTTSDDAMEYPTMASPFLSPTRDRNVAPGFGDLEFRPGNLLARAFGALLDWNDRYRQRVHLGQMDDRMLRDIGMSRGEAMHEYDKPFWRG